MDVVVPNSWEGVWSTEPYMCFADESTANTKWNNERRSRQGSVGANGDWEKK